MQISFCFCKTCICLKILENIQISVNMIDRLDITDDYSVKCNFILNSVFIDAALKVIYKGCFKSFVALYADRICSDQHFVENRIEKFLFV